MIKVCLVGCGYIAKQHLVALLGNDSIEVVGLVDPNQEAAVTLSKQLPHPEQCQTFSSIDALHQSQLPYDAAVIMTPHDVHVECARKCIQASKHVLLEKPVSTTIAGCMELQGIAQSTDRVLMIAENSRFWPEVVHAKRLIEEGVIGEVYHGVANYWESMDSDNFSYGDEKGPIWTAYPERVGGGILMAGTVHWTRSLRIMLGDIHEVIGYTATPWAGTKGESLSHSLLRCANGLTGVLNAHMNSIPMAKLPFFQIFGSKGEIAIHGDFDGGISVYTKDCPAGKEIKTLGGYWGSFKPQMEEFISLVKDNKPLNDSHGGSVLQGTRDILVTMAIYRSVETGKWETTDLANYHNK